MELDEEYRLAGEIEPDSDSEDIDTESQLSQWLGELENYAKRNGLCVGGGGSEAAICANVVRSLFAAGGPNAATLPLALILPAENQDVNFDAILGELTELESQLGTAQSHMSAYSGSCLAPSLVKDEQRDSGNDLAHAELEALASEITLSLKYRNNRPLGEMDYFHSHYPGDLGGYNDPMFDIGETDSAFSESASLPSSESFTSMVTVSSAADANWAGDTGSNSSGSTITPQSTHSDVEQKAILQAEKIRIALEKIKEAKIRKLFVRAFARDGSSKSIMVDEKMTIGEIISMLADKNHIRLNAHLAVVEHMPELFMERILEDHDSLVETMVMWTSDTQNRILFDTRPQKNDLLLCPEKYLLVPSSSETGASLDPKRRENLIQDFFSGSASKVPPVEGVLHVKADGKKAWKKFFFVLRASGLYYNPKGKISKAPKDLTCLAQFDFVELYTGVNWKKKYNAPTNLCFALKHPQIQKKTSKFIRFLCAENKAAFDQWVMGIRIAKYGKQLLTNYQNLQHEILAWDSRDLRSSISDQSVATDVITELKHPDSNLQGSRLSMPEPNSRHSIVTVKNSMLVREPSDGCREEVVCLQIDENLMSERRTAGLSTTDAGKAHVKRVSFSATPSVIHDGGGDVNGGRHRDSIVSASTDSSEDSTSSGEARMSHRSKLRPRLPVTTGTTRQISEMVQTSMDAGSSGSFDEYSDDWKPVSSPVQKEYGLERRKSAPAFNDSYVDQRPRTNSHEDRSLGPRSPTVQSPHTESCRGPARQQKASYKSHSRGSSISSMDSADSYQGSLLSPTMPAEPFYGQTSEYDHSRFPLYETITATSPAPGHMQSHMTGNMSPGPLTPPAGSVPRSAPPTAQKPSSKKSRPQSGPATGPVEIGHRRNASRSSLEAVEEVTAISGPVPPTTTTARGSPVPPRAAMPPPPPPPQHMAAVPPSSPGVGQPQQLTHPSSHPDMPAMALTYQQVIKRQAGLGRSDAMPVSVPPSGPPVMLAGSLGQSEFLAGQTPRGLKITLPPPKHTHSHIVPPSPPPLVPPTPRNLANPVKTHKKRPSGDNFVVSGNQSLPCSPLDYPDIAMVKPGVTRLSELPLPSCSPGPTQTKSGQGQCAINSDEVNYAPLPFMAELNKHMHESLQQGSPNQPVCNRMHQTSQYYDPTSQNVHMQKFNQNVDGRLPPETLPKPTEHRHRDADSNLNHSAYNKQLTKCASSPGMLENKVGSLGDGRRSLPPPPPKRSETTKLTSVSQPPPVDIAADDQNHNDHIDPIYDNCEGILDISDLPPPPPELLDGYHNQNGSPVPQSSKGWPPPPPPPRNKDTQLSSVV